MKNKILKTTLIIISILFAIPSVMYMQKNTTILNFNGNLEYCFLLTENISRLYQAAIYTVILIAFIISYYLIIKKRENLFQNTKQIYKYIIAVSLIFVFVVPFWSSDIFYYLGIGRLSSKYKQNPYYTDMKSYIDKNNINIKKDTVMQKGYSNYWSNTTVVYGAIWTLICSIVSALSFGNIDFGLLLFKIINLTIHIANCYLIYKISRKKIFPIIYGLNPFILIEGIANVHNDIFVIFFMLLAIYEVYRKKRLTLGLLFLALATDIKYFSILLLPFLIIYQYRNKKVIIRILKCIQYGLIFLAFAMIPYMLYIRDINVFIGVVTQSEKLAKGLYLLISEYTNGTVTTIVKTIIFTQFAMSYVTACFIMLFKENIKFYKQMRTLFYFMIAFLFLLITNFQPWYFIWLVPLIMWQKPKNIKLIIQMQLMTLIANIVFLIYSEKYEYGITYFLIFTLGTILAILGTGSKFHKKENQK